MLRLSLNRKSLIKNLISDQNYHVPEQVSSMRTARFEIKTFFNQSKNRSNPPFFRNQYTSVLI